MEYLMTYGWAILVIIIVIAVLFYIGVLNPRNVTPSSCTFPPGISCVSYKLVANTGQLSLTLGQATGHSMQILGIKCTKEIGVPVATGNTTSGWATNGDNIPIGEQRLIHSTIQCYDINGTVAVSGSTAQLGEFYKGKIWIWYNETDTGVTRTAIGDLATKFEQ